ncbi:MAG: methyltransferase domain protein [bacterium P3]|nr:MAG: methyltransferase domain protein [bacterium P3]KWW39004.1 MAG: methyltransferase domain protein [bacterium F083]
MNVPSPVSEEDKFDVVLVHDVIEHIEPPFKAGFVAHVESFMRRDAIVFFAFPAWQMPFGGHQQICRSKLSIVPYLHLLPTPLYRMILRACKEPVGVVDELLSIKRSGLSVEQFEHLAAGQGLQTVKRTLWFINPHYKQKFGLKPRVEIWGFNKLYGLRDFYTTSAWYLLADANSGGSHAASGSRPA